MSFADFLSSRLPRWLKGPWGLKFIAVTGGLVDTINTGALQAGEQHFPQSAAADAVPFHGRERLIPRILGESTEAWRARLVDAWNIWVNSSTIDGYAAVLRTYLKEDSLFAIPAHDWLVDPVSDYDNDIDNWSRVFLILLQPHRFTQPVIGSSLVVDPQQLVGISMTYDELQDFRANARHWLGAHAIPVELRVYFGSGFILNDVVLHHNKPGGMANIPLYTNAIGQPWFKTVGPAMVIGQLYV